MFEDLPSGSPRQVTYPLQAACHHVSVGFTQGGGPALLTDSACPLSEAGKQATWVLSPIWFPRGGTLAPGERDRTEKKEDGGDTYHFVLGGRNPQPASQKCPCPFRLTMALPLTPGRGLRDGRLLSGQPSVPVCWDAVLFSQEFHLKVLAVPVRVGSYLPAPPLAKAPMGLRGGAPLTGIQPA